MAQSGIMSKECPNGLANKECLNGLAGKTVRIAGLEVPVNAFPPPKVKGQPKGTAMAAATSGLGQTVMAESSRTLGSKDTVSGESSDNQGKSFKAQSRWVPKGSAAINSNAPSRPRMV